MNTFDSSLIQFLNKFAGSSETFEAFIMFIVDNSYIKTIVLVCILWFFWFQNSFKLTENRRGVIVCLFSCIVAIIVGRLLSVALPFRLRPIINPDINFIRPSGWKSFDLGTMSSFPSDNAVMFFSLATGIFLISRKVGIFAYLYVTLVVCFPRVYLGYHFPTDILVGAAIGILITYLLSIKKIRETLSNRVFEFSSKHTGAFYVMFFLLIYEITKMFIEARYVTEYMLKAIRGII